MNPNTQLTKPAEKSVMEFVPYGSQDKIKLSIDIIKNIVAVKTKSGVTCDDRQAMKFMMLCQAQRLNPFAGDAYLIGYDGRDGAQFSLITAHQAFLKRAEVCKDFDGMESGVIIKHKESGQISEVEGDFYDNQESDLIGGWAIVHHKARNFPTKRKLALKSFAKNYGVWLENPAGMICKCAEADALRSTFPTLLGGLYIEDELPTRTVVDVTAGSNLIQQITDQPEQAKAAKPDEKLAEVITPSQELESVVLKSGHDFATFQRWGIESGNVSDADSLSGFADIKNAVAIRLLRNKQGMVDALARIKAVEV